MVVVVVDGGGEKWNIYKADWIHFIVFVTNEIFAKPHQRRQINEDGSWIWRRQWMSLWKNNTYGVKGKKLLLVIGTVQFELLLHENFNCCDSIGFQVKGESRLFSSEDGPTLVSLKFCDIAAFHLWLSFKSLSFILTTILFIFLKYIDILFFLGYGCRYCSI